MAAPNAEGLSLSGLPGTIGSGSLAEGAKSKGKRSEVHWVDGR